MAISKIIYQVEGMSCSHCENRVKNAVSSLDGVSGVSVSLEEKTVSVEYDPSKTTEGRLAETIEGQGYDVIK